MEEVHIRDASEESEKLIAPELEGLTEEEARRFKEIFKRFIASYKQKAPDVSIEDWLTGQFRAEMPDISEDEAKKLSRETVASVEEYDKRLADLKAATEKGHSKERWVADKLQEASAGMAVAEYGQKLAVVDQTLQTANEQMLRTVLRTDGEISQALNLEGFIAEQAHVNSFNEAAALRGEPFRAEVCVPDGTYDKNSFDVVIKDVRTGKIVHQYQMKYGADAKATIQLLKRGNYNNQIIVVPPEQVAEVQAAFPGKTVVSKIGLEEIKLFSKDFSKETVNAYKERVQAKGEIPADSWNSYNTRELALHLGKNAVAAGMQAAVIGTGFSLAAKVFSGDEIDENEVLQTALATGADAGVKSAATGAMVVASGEGGPLKAVIPKGTPISTIANIACVAVENVKILGKVATGDLTMTEGLELMGQTSTAMYCGLSCAPFGAAVGSLALSFIPIVGPIVGGLVGGSLAYTAGSKFGETVFNGVKTIAKAGVGLVKKAASGVRRVFSGIANGIRSILS